MLFRAKEKGVGSGTSKEKKIIHRKMEELMSGKHMLAGSDRKYGTQRGIPLLVHVTLYISMVLAPFLEKFLYLNSFRHLREGQNFFVSILFLENSLQSFTCQRKTFWGRKFCSCLKKIIQLS